MLIMINEIEKKDLMRKKKLKSEYNLNLSDTNILLRKRKERVNKKQ